MKPDKKMILQLLRLYDAGKKIVHTLDPLTGSAEEIDILSANVIAPTCAEADAWATAFMAMGLDKTLRFLDEHQEIKCFLISQA